MRNEGTRRYVEQDANYNVTSITDASGAVQERFVYDPYGREQTYDASWSAVTSKNLTPLLSAPDTDADAWIYGFQGGRFDTGTGLYAFGARDYSSDLGRWVEADPTGAHYVNGAIASKWAKGMERVRSLRYSGFPCQAMPTLKPSPWSCGLRRATAAGSACR
jgi:RHS repeat-associated protein